MSDKNQSEMGEIKVDPNSLFREETFTDLKVASIRCLTPMKSDGTVDESRAPIYIGQAHIMSEAGPLPLQFPLEANNLKEATEVFPGAVKKAVEKMVAELKELQQKEKSKIIVPGEGEGKIKLS